MTRTLLCVGGGFTIGYLYAMIMPLAFAIPLSVLTGAIWGGYVHRNF